MHHEVACPRIHRARYAKGLSQEVLAHEAGCRPPYIRSLERGVYAATIAMVGKLAEVHGVEPDELLLWAVRSPPRAKR